MKKQLQIGFGLDWMPEGTAQAQFELNPVDVIRPEPEPEFS